VPERKGGKNPVAIIMRRTIKRMQGDHKRCDDGAVDELAPAESKDSKD